MYELFLDIVDLVNTFGYLGIFIMTFIESTFVPIPCEVTLIPAGYLIQQGKMNPVVVWLVSILGTLGGSLFNYCIAYHFGRMLLLQYGKYLFIDEAKLKKMENFFKKHGAVSMFTGRLLPGIKHFISFPAGLGKMNVKTFSLYTAAGAAIWCTILLTLGFMIGESEHLIKKYLKQVNYILLVVVIGVISFYAMKIRRKKRSSRKK